MPGATTGQAADDAQAGALAAARDQGLRALLTIATGGQGRIGLSIVPLPVALTHAHAGHAVPISFERSRIAETLSVDAHAREHGLTTREQQVLAALCDGLPARDIAARLAIGEATVRARRAARRPGLMRRHGCMRRDACRPFVATRDRRSEI